jgi:hypothetical protein
MTSSIAKCEPALRWECRPERVFSKIEASERIGTRVSAPIVTVIQSGLRPEVHYEEEDPGSH